MFSVTNAGCFVYIPASLFLSHSFNFIHDAAVWLKIHVCVWLMRRPFACPSPICCSHLCGPTTLALRSWSLKLTLKEQNITELRSTAAFREGKTSIFVRTFNSNKAYFAVLVQFSLPSCISAEQFISPPKVTHNNKNTSYVSQYKLVVHNTGVSLRKQTLSLLTH